MSVIGHIKLQSYAVELLVLTMSLAPFVLFVHFFLTEASGHERFLFLLPPWFYSARYSRRMRHWYYKREMGRVFDHPKS